MKKNKGYIFEVIGMAVLTGLYAAVVKVKDDKAMKEEINDQVNEVLKEKGLIESNEEEAE